MSFVQACQLLNLLSKQFQIDFESFAEVFIPVLFRSVVVTVLVIGESADHCIKTMLENCRVARVLPRIIECAKHDRNAILRTKFAQMQGRVTKYTQNYGQTVHAEFSHYLTLQFKSSIMTKK